MIRQNGEASKLKLSVKDVKSSMKKDEVYVMGFFDNLNDPKLRMYMDAGEWIQTQAVVCSCLWDVPRRLGRK